MISRSSVLRTVAVTAAAGTLIAVGHPAKAGGSATREPGPPSTNVVEVVGSSAGFTMSDSSPAGFTTFEARSSHPGGGLFVLWKLRPEATLEQALTYAAKGLSDDRPESVEGGRGLHEQVEVLGSAAVLPGQPVSFTSLLRPGTYYMVDYQDLREGGVPRAAERSHELTVTPRWHPAPPPDTNATAVFTLHGDRAEYLVPDVLPSGEPLRMVNAMPQLTEAVFMPVRPDTTHAQLREFFAAVDRGEGGVEAPFTGGPVGLPALSPGHVTTVEAALQPGRYVLMTWYPNVDSGTMLAAQGAFALVTIV